MPYQDYEEASVNKRGVFHRISALWRQDTLEGVCRLPGLTSLASHPTE
jgi:hypothetical protein